SSFLRGVSPSPSCTTRVSLVRFPSDRVARSTFRFYRNHGQWHRGSKRLSRLPLLCPGSSRHRIQHLSSTTTFRKHIPQCSYLLPVLVRSPIIANFHFGK